MLSKRDKILIRPWEERKYENHLRKVQSALPVIDNKPPPFREHVATKLKKKQKEVERIKKIENENLILLRKMNYIMRTSRVDNYWTQPLPNFLNRVSIYKSIEKSLPKQNDIFEETVDLDRNHKRKSKCIACTPQKKTETQLPEERVPWEPAKLQTIKNRSKSVPIFKTQLPTIIEKEPKKPKSCITRKYTAHAYNREPSKKDLFYKGSKMQKLILTRGALKLSLNFPSDTVVKLQTGIDEKIIVDSNCFCKNSV